MKELKDLQAGDEVIVDSLYDRTIAKVDRVTKTQIVIGTERFRKQSGWSVGGNIWHRKSIYVPTEEDISEIKEEALRKKILYTIRSFDFKRLSKSELENVYNLIKDKL